MESMSTVTNLKMCLNVSLLLIFSLYYTPFFSPLCLCTFTTKWLRFIFFCTVNTFSNTQAEYAQLKKKIAGHCYKLFYIIHGTWHGSVAERSKALV